MSFTIVILTTHWVFDVALHLRVSCGSKYYCRTRKNPWPGWTLFMSSRFSWRRPTPPQLDYNTSMSMRQGVQRVGFMPFLRKGKANIELRHLSSLIKVNLPTWMYRVLSVLEGGGSCVSVQNWYSAKGGFRESWKRENFSKAMRIRKRKKEKRTGKIKREMVFTTAATRLSK